MKTACRLTIATIVLAAFNVTVQTPAELGLQTYAGLTITGAVGAVDEGEKTERITKDSAHFLGVPWR